MRFASGLEAQYIVAEAQGPTAATLAFVNARRAVGNEPPVSDTGNQLMADLREQRRRDFFLRCLPPGRPAPLRRAGHHRPDLPQRRLAR